ncbi:MAG TPA: SNF2-related protein [Candidatus Baltobacteraceae bacterium]
MPSNEIVALPFHIDDVRRALDAHTLSKGSVYQREGRVMTLALDEKGRRLTALVSGSRRQVYRVDVEIMASPRHSALDGVCTCLVRFNCKHVAAVVLEALERYSPTSKLAIVESDPADAAVEKWLRDIAGAARREDPPQESAEHIVYLLDVQSSRLSPTLTIDAGVVRALKTGEPSKPRPYSLTNLGYTSANFVHASDLFIGRLLRAGHAPPALTPAIDPELTEVLLRRLIPTGRCYWRSWGNPPLQEGGARSARLTWTLDADGRQRAAYDDPSGKLVLIPASPPWYVDVETWTCGPVDFGIPGNVAAAVLRAPPLAREHVARLRRVLETELDGMNVPAPRQTAEQPTIEDDPVPSLTLYARSASSMSRYAYSLGGSQGAEPATMAFARLQFDYDGTLVDPQGGPDEFLRVSGEEIERWPRRFSFEKRSADRLVNSGLEHFRALGLHSSESQDSEFRFPFGSDDERWARFLDRIVPALRADGWHVRLEDSFPHRVVSAAQPWQARLSESENRWFELDLGVDIDGERVALLPAIVDALRRLPDISPEAIDALSESVYGRIPGGAFVAIPVARFKTVLTTLVELFARDALSDEGKLDITLAQAMNFESLETAGYVDWSGGDKLRGLARSLRAGAGVTEIPLPKGLKTELRPYQHVGMNWLQFLRREGLGGILADDMGLGKTVQTLAHVLVEKNNHRLRKPVLIVAPTSVVENWRSEAARFAPELRVLTLHGPDRAARHGEIERAHIVLTSYALLLRDQETLLAQEWHIVVLDEAQAIKNPHAKLTKVAARLKAEQRLALTGTPIENNLDELWSLCTFVMPGLLDTRQRFTRVFRTPIEKLGDVERRSLLAARLRPFMLRRTKDQVAPQLPEKTEIVQRVELTGKQRDLYETVRLAMHDRVRREVETRGFARSRIVVLDALLKLRQVCCDPRLVRLAAGARVTQSAKLELLLELLPEMLEEGRRVLLFSQFTSMLDLIKPELHKLRIPFVELRGDTKDRITPVARFQNREVPLFLVSLKAGGTGLNLTAADTVIHYDPWWNPAVERQATDRAHRIGQEQHVFVYKFITVGTVEERIAEMQARKGALAEALLDANADVATAFDSQDIERLFAPLDELHTR